jgi:hypothetical protein
MPGLCTAVPEPRLNLAKSLGFSATADGPLIIAVSLKRTTKMTLLGSPAIAAGGSAII